MKNSSDNKILPHQIRLEASTICQLNCPSCPTASGQVAQMLGSGFLKFSDFKTIVDNNPWVSEIELSNWGEIFLNKELIQILRYAYKKNVALQASNGVNLSNASEKILETLVKYRFRVLTCSIDGASPQTYSQYRRNGNFQRVIDNIKVINKFKHKYHSQYPLLKWQFVIFGHNENEIRQAREMAKELGMKFSPKLSWDDLYSDSFSPIHNAELVREESGLGVATREEYWLTYHNIYVENCCLELWNQPQINYDGRLLGCCINYWKDYGNVFQDGLVACLNNEKINSVRQMLTGQRDATEEMPCIDCKVYQKRKQNNYWIKIEDIRKGYAKKRAYLYTKKRAFIMLENKILGTSLTESLRSAYKITRLFKNIIYQNIFNNQRIRSGVHSLQIPLSMDKNKFWQPFQIFKGTVKGLSKLSCHASMLVSGHSPHKPHRHQEEELLLLLSGQVDIILPDASDKEGKVRRPLKVGEFVYYPRYFAHTIVTTGDSPANYLMFKWHSARQNQNTELLFGRFDIQPSVVDKNLHNGFRSQRIFMGRTAYLSKLECHFSTLSPKAGYATHIDNYDVAIVVLEGQVETLGKLASSYDVIFYSAGKPHGMYNPGQTEAKYLVFEFHSLKSHIMRWICWSHRILNKHKKSTSHLL